MNNSGNSLRAALVLLLCLAVAGCRKKAKEAASATDAEAAVRTTDGAITEGNMDSQIDGWEHILKDLRQGSVQAMAGLATLYDTRAQYFGKLAGYDRAEELAELAVKTQSGDPEGILELASMRAAMHRFPEALLELDAAAKAGAKQAAVRSLRASVLQAQGHLEEALALRRAGMKEYATVFTLGALGAAEGAAGDAAEAEQHFAQAIKVYRDTSPLPIAWVDFQRGMLAEKAGLLDRAADRYAAAHARLPQYAQATGHLAGIILALQGDKTRAVALLRPLLMSTDDPEYEGQLATLLINSTDPAEAAEGAALRTKAAARYEELLTRHPQAFADHAARFFLTFDPSRALNLARKNLEVRQTVEAYDLALSAAALARDVSAGCTISQQALARPSPSRRIQALAASACPATAEAGAHAAR